MTTLAAVLAAISPQEHASVSRVAHVLKLSRRATRKLLDRAVREGHLAATQRRSGTLYRRILP